MDTQSTLLLIEDDLYTRELYAQVLSDAGFAVETATDGEAGFEMANRGGYRAIVMDIMLPKMDGLKILRALHASPPSVHNGPVIVLTNLAKDSVTKECLANNAAACLTKTDYNPDQMVEKVKSIIASHT